MHTFEDIAIRILVYGFLFALVLMRAAVPNPIYALLLRGTAVDRCLFVLRPVIRWSRIGPIQIRSPLSRLTLAFYSRDWNFFASVFCQRLVTYFAAEGDPVAALNIAFQTFNSDGSPDVIESRSSPEATRTLYTYRPTAHQRGGV